MVFCWPKFGSKHAGEIHVGIDVGTSHTGVAYCVQGSPHKIRVIDSWPSLNSSKALKSVKVPTKIAYDGRKVHWGFQANAVNNERIIHAFKLLLNPHKDPNYEPAEESRLILKGLDKKPIDVMIDYLKGLLKHIKSEIHRQVGKMAKNMDWKFCFTKPVDWPDTAYEALIHAAAKAGMDKKTISVISEPEAALIDCLRGLDSENIKKKGGLLLIDAGHRQVEVTSYQREEAVLKMQDTRASGLCASELLDVYFEDLLQKLFGLAAYNELPPRARQQAMDYWRTSIKLKFGNSEISDSQDDMTFSLSMPGAKDDLSAGLENEVLMIDCAQVQGIFDTVIGEIKKLVDSQITSANLAGQKIRFIALAGGLGSSTYLIQQMKKAYPEIKVMRRPQAWAAAARGAALKGIRQNEEPHRIAQHSYGIRYAETFDPEIHLKEDKRWDYHRQIWVAGKQLKWGIWKGDPIPEDTKIETWWCRFFYDNELSIPGSDLIYTCDGDEPPKRCAGEAKNDMEVHKLPWDFSSIDKSQLENLVNSKGLNYKRLVYRIVLTSGPKSLIAQIKIDEKVFGEYELPY